MVIAVFPSMQTSQREKLSVEQDHGRGSEVTGSQSGEGAVLEKPRVRRGEERPLCARNSASTTTPRIPFANGGVKPRGCYGKPYLNVTANNP